MERRFRTLIGDERPLGEYRMSFFTWSEDLFFGIESIDAHHERIADLASELDNAVRSKNEADAARLFVEMAALLEEHFADEEQIMREKVTTPEAQAHLDEHIHFHDQIRQLLDYGRQKIEQETGILVVLPAISGQYFEEIATEDEKLKKLLDTL